MFLVGVDKSKEIDKRQTYQKNQMNNDFSSYTSLMLFREMKSIKQQA